MRRLREMKRNCFNLLALNLGILGFAFPLIAKDLVAKAGNNYLILLPAAISMLFLSCASLLLIIVLAFKPMEVPRNEYGILNSKEKIDYGKILKQFNTLEKDIEARQKEMGLLYNRAVICLFIGSLLLSAVSIAQLVLQ